MKDHEILLNDIVTKARYEIIGAGYEELRTPEAIDQAFNRKGTTLVMINSICGCAGGVARPAAEQSLEYHKKPNYLVTVFAGRDKEATERARSYFEGYEPSSPSFALLKDGKICTMIERHDMHGKKPLDVISKLQKAFDQYCDVG